ncbi:MAG TPA: methylated-DNA--[protein]-cysteine S-methyltransferase [Thermoanaerobaculia bacterium]|nr:methylated-DNA--[protein]-cysteine S-methyltransferase [Thermoanaerobaculia bacterium]
MTIDSPIGPLTIAVDAEGRLTELRFTRSDDLRQLPAANCQPVARQLHEYFSGHRRTFDLPLALKGTPFQIAVWTELQNIGYGDTISYMELAHRIGRPAAIRAVGAANGANPIPVIVPCHRVIGANGSLTGYGGGIERKQWLLALEGRRLF